MTSNFLKVATSVVGPENSRSLFPSCSTMEEQSPNGAVKKMFQEYNYRTAMKARVSSKQLWNV
jgi:hypothetical protein